MVFSYNRLGYFAIFCSEREFVELYRISLEGSYRHRLVKSFMKNFIRIFADATIVGS